jgi:hypothetical protein
MPWSENPINPYSRNYTGISGPDVPDVRQILLTVQSNM